MNQPAYDFEGALKRGVSRSQALKEGWQALAGEGLEIHEIEGDHINIIKEPFVGQLAAELNSCLDKAQTTRSPRRKASSPNLEIAA